MGPVHLPVQLERIVFGFQADEMKARYEWTLLEETPEFGLIRVTPRLEADKRAFSSVFIKVDKKTLVPGRILIIDPNGKDRQDYQFQVVATNPKIDSKYFDPLVPQGWKEIHGPK
jgi:outer membrane lipoprotein-sorting protein